MSAIKRAVKKVGKFVKKHWRTIVVAAAVVFTAGVAAGGLGAVKGAFATKGIMGGIGSTLKAGATAIGKVVTGQGLGAAKAGAQSALGVSNAASTAASTIGSGLSGGSGIGGGLNAGAGAAGTTGSAASNAALTFGNPGVTAATTGGAGVLPAAASTVAAGAAPVAAQTAAGGFMNSLGGAALIQGGIGALSGYLQGQAQDEQEPQGYYGVGMNGNQSLSPDQVAFRDSNISGGSSSWNKPTRSLIYDPQGG